MNKLVDLVGVVLGEPALHALGFGEHGIKHAAVFGDGGLALFQGQIIG